MLQHNTNLSSLLILAMIAALASFATLGCGEEEGGGTFTGPLGEEGAAGGDSGEEGGTVIAADFIVTQKLAELIEKSCVCIDGFVEAGSLPSNAQISSTEECVELLTVTLNQSFNIENPDCIAVLMTTNSQIKDAMECVGDALQIAIDCQDTIQCSTPAEIQSCNYFSDDLPAECNLYDEVVVETMKTECGLNGGNVGTNADTFDCGNGEFIPTAYQCDGDPQCTNGADETDCGSIGFECSDGSSIATGKVCDGEADCPDGDDEASDLCG